MARIQLSNVHKNFGATKVIRGVDIDIEDGEFVVFVGPSGCGKSTLLRLIAGLEDITSGELRIDDRVVNELQPKERGVAMVFQSYAIFPHMTVRENIAFGLTIRKEDKHEIERKVSAAARMLQMEELLDRRPSQLSGGQRQRVAIGRAIVRDPTVFLFDEPLSNLDAALRMSTRQEISSLHHQLKTTMIYVTHDQVEAMTLADKIVVLKNGEVMQVGAPMELFHHPANLFVAGFLGAPSMNFMDVTVQACDDQFATVSGSSVQDISVPHRGRRLEVGQHATLGVRPQHLKPVGPGAGCLTGTVLLTERLGSETVIDVKLETGDKIIAALPEDAVMEIGSTASFDLDTKLLHLFDEVRV
ncbi:MAG: sn-glycerol-3-phosphate ABC transporter ATP-binding protein UgpC [Gammaproteobacteria bacterium]|nr:sn-glycerol-3-phosphate ABC transporter ATP-binding protein UgpC [Gammaproteobacteria bacterium]